MDGYIIKSTEGRLMLGITIFVVTMILIGWIAINEPARMESFVQQHQGRSIELGGELFAANCSNCHGKDGRGTGQGPALNNPHLFGYDFMADVNGQIAAAQREIDDLEALEAPTEENLARIEELNGHLDFGAGLLGQLARGEDVSDEIEASQNELEELNALEEPTDEDLDRIKELDELLGFEALLPARDELLGQMGVAGLKGYLPNLAKLQADLEAGTITPLAFTQALIVDANRLAQISWGGSVDGYLQTTMIHGRPGSNNVWPGDGMVSWSQRGGGPLRDDQIDNIVTYIMNWNKGDNWTIDDLNAVNQFALIHADSTLIGDVAAASSEGGPSGLGPESCAAVDGCASGFGTVTEIAAALPEGDAANGLALYASLGCIGCHTGGVVGPDTIGTWARTEGERLAEQPDGEWTAEEFIVAAIIYPNHFVPDPYLPNLMTPTFGQQLTIEQLGDIVAYLRTQ